MTVSNGTSNLEQRTDGLWIHHGKMNVGPIGFLPTGATRGQAGDLGVHRGDNTGAIYFGSGDNYLYFNGAGFTFKPALDSTALAAGAAQALLGAQNYQTVWNHPGTGWAATPLTYTGAFTGAIVRIDVSMDVQSSVGSNYFHMEVRRDGTSILGSGPAQTITGYTQCGYTLYDTPTVAVHTYQVFVYASLTGLSTIGGVPQTFYITEQRR